MTRTAGCETDIRDEPAQLVVPRLLTIATVARILECSSRTVRRRIDDRTLPAVLEHGRTMVRGDELRSYIDGLEPVGGRPSARSRRPPRVGGYDFLAS